MRFGSSASAWCLHLPMRWRDVEALTRFATAVYEVAPSAMRGVRDRGVSSEPPALEPDGGNVADVLAYMAEHNDPNIERINDYMRAVVPQFRAAYGQLYGSKVALMVRQRL